MVVRYHRVLRDGLILKRLLITTPRRHRYGCSSPTDSLFSTLVGFGITVGLVWCVFPDFPLVFPR